MKRTVLLLCDPGAFYFELVDYQIAAGCIATSNLSFTNESALSNYKLCIGIYDVEVCCLKGTDVFARAKQENNSKGES